MENQLSVKDLEFIIEAMENVNVPAILAEKFAHETVSAIKAKLDSTSISDYIKGKEYINQNAEKMIAALKDFEEETTLIRGKLITMRRELQKQEA